MPLYGYLRRYNHVLGMTLNYIRLEELIQRGETIRRVVVSRKYHRVAASRVRRAMGALKPMPPLPCGYFLAEERLRDQTPTKSAHAKAVGSWLEYIIACWQKLQLT